MTTMMKKATLGVALAAAALTAAVPADAQRYRGYGGGYRHYHHGGDAATGALLGGIVGLGLGAAISSNNRDRYYDRGYYDRGYYDEAPIVVRERYYAPPPPPRVIYRDRYYTPGYGYGYGYPYPY